MTKDERFCEVKEEIAAGQAVGCASAIAAKEGLFVKDVEIEK